VKILQLPFRITPARLQAASNWQGRLPPEGFTGSGHLECCRPGCSMGGSVDGGSAERHGSEPKIEPGTVMSRSRY